MKVRATRYLTNTGMAALHNHWHTVRRWPTYYYWKWLSVLGILFTISRKVIRRSSQYHKRRPSDAELDICG